MNRSEETWRWILVSVLLLLVGIQSVSAEPGYEYAMQWGGMGAGDGQLNYPQGIALDCGGAVYVVDQNNARIQKFDSAGHYLLQWGSSGSGDGQFSRPAGIAVDGDGDVYVSDGGNNRIQKFTSVGGFLLKWNGSESSAGQFNQPMSIAVDHGGEVYVADTFNRRILKFNSTGVINSTWSCRGTFSSPAGVVVDNRGDLYVSDLILNTVQEFDPTGTFIRRWNGSDSGTRFFGPAGVAVTSGDGNVFVTDILNNRVLEFTSTGGFVTQWNGSESEAGLFGNPQDVEVDGDGNVYVADSNNNRIVKFRPYMPPSIAYFTANVTNGTTPLPVQFTDRSTNNPANWSWSFGDGNTSADQNPVHTYTAAGNYTVTLTVSNAGGENTTVRTDCITVHPPVYAPVATFTANVTNGTTPLPVQFTDRSTNDPTNWSWSFGDGNTSADQNPVHTYTAAGNHTVTLTVSNAGGENTTVRTDCITVHAPVPPTTFPTTTIPTTVRTSAPKTTARTPPPTTAPTTLPPATAATPTPTATAEPVLANFTTNTTSGQAPFPVRFTDQSTGTVRQYFWQFGDGGASFDRDPVHVYTAAGRFTVSLVAIGSTGAEVKTIERYITVDSPVTTTSPTATPVTMTLSPTTSGQDLPIANFTVIFPDGTGPMGIRVTDTTTNATSVCYDLGDGTTTTCRNFTYIYRQPGIYTITLVATNDAGSSTRTVAMTVPITTALPVSNFALIFPEGPGSMRIAVTNAAVDAASVSYDLGDGTTTASPNFTYTYWQPGTYTLTQTATNAAGIATKTISVTVPAVLTPTPLVSPTVTGPGSPFNGSHIIPGTLQAEDYDIGGEGVAYHDTTPGNEGGIYRQDDADIEQIDSDNSPSVGWTRAGEWLAYTVNVSTAGTYDAGFRVASSHVGSAVMVCVDDDTTPVATVTVPNTGGWPVFQTVSVLVTLPVGQHRLKLAFPTGGMNLNWIGFALKG